MTGNNLFTAVLCVLIGVLAGRSANAADLNSRDFFSAPVGTSLGVLYLPATRASDFHAASGVVDDASLRVNAVAYRQLWFSDVCGLLCTPQFIIPYADIDARLPGSTSSRSERGVGDPQIGGTLFFINDPDNRRYSGLLAMLALPLGEYHSENPDVSPGANRWALNLNYNYTQGVGRDWVLEANLEAHLYGKNDDYFGADLEQRPLYRLQAFASYDFTPKTYGALRLVHAEGGELRLGGKTLDDTRQRYTQVGFEVGHWFTQTNQVLVSLGRNVETDNGFHRSEALLRLVHVF